MRLRRYVSMAILLSSAGLAAKADTISVFNVKNQSASSTLGTFTVNTTTGMVQAINLSLSINGLTELFNTAPSAQSYNRNLNEYVSTFMQGGNELLFALPVLTLQNYDPLSRATCRTNAVNCDYLANVYNGPIASANLVDTFEGNLTLSSSTATGVTPEPASIALLGTGLLMAAGALRRRLA